MLRIATGLVLANSAVGQEDRFSANSLTLMPSRAEQPSPYCRLICNYNGMCVGIIDAIDFIMRVYPPEQPEYRSCSPNDVPLKQPIQAVISYIDTHDQSGRTKVLKSSLSRQSTMLGRVAAH